MTRDGAERERIRIGVRGLWGSGKTRDRSRERSLHGSISRLALAQCRFLGRFERIDGEIGKADAILSAAAAHHLLLWIHPFLDGDGRVARLMSHAMLLDLLGSGAIWSVARGLARQVEQRKQLLANCDLPRRNDLDGRGKLSEEALAEFTRFFLQVCIDQVAFMESLMQPDRTPGRDRENHRRQ